LKRLALCVFSFGILSFQGVFCARDISYQARALLMGNPFYRVKLDLRSRIDEVRRQKSSTSFESTRRYSHANLSYFITVKAHSGYDDRLNPAKCFEARAFESDLFENGRHGELRQIPELDQALTVLRSMQSFQSVVEDIHSDMLNKLIRGKV
jgi:hypothetical protein